MGRRRPWVIGSQICAFLASLGLLLVRNPPTEYVKTLVIAFFVHSVFASIQDASVDAQAITTIPLSERGRVNGFMRGGFLVGSAVGAAGLSWILRNRSYILAASINSVILFTFTFITFFIKEKSDDKLLPCSRRKGDRRKKHYTKPYDYSICRLFIELFKGLLSLQSLRFFIPILLVYASQSAFIRAYNSKRATRQIRCSCLVSSSSDQSARLVRYIGVHSFWCLEHRHRRCRSTLRWLVGRSCRGSSSACRCDFHSCLLYDHGELARTSLVQTTRGHRHSRCLDDDGSYPIDGIDAGTDVPVSVTRRR